MRRKRFPWVELIWTDSSYNEWQVEAAVAKVPLLRMEIVKRTVDFGAEMTVTLAFGNKCEVGACTEAHECLRYWLV